MTVNDASLDDNRDNSDNRPVRGTSGTYGDQMSEPRLVPSGEAARALGISARTLQRYVKAGLVTPDLTLASGQYRWDVARLREQINALSAPEDH